MSYRSMVDVCEVVANDGKAPATIVDWASALYDRLIDNEAVVLVGDLLLLDLLSMDYEAGLCRVAHTLIARS